jgi:NAD+ kinase
MKFALFGNTYQAKKSAHTARLLEILTRHKAQVSIHREFYQFLTRDSHLALTGVDIFDDGAVDADMVLSIGGDGTFLKAASQVGNRQIPILGINTGRLGFLADVSPEEMEATFDEIHRGEYRVEKRSTLEVTTDGQALKGYPFGLNEVAILKRDSSSMISIHASVDGAYLTTYQADGLVIATPTGSTAYSLSVGAPIIVPTSRTISITPVAPHSLNIRPLVINDDSVITLDVESRSHNFLIAIDGRSETCREGCRLHIRKAAHTVSVVKRRQHAFFDTLRQKLMWGADGRGDRE